MCKVEWYADKMEEILGRCDGGKNYSWCKAAEDIDELLSEIKRYRPRSRGSRLIRRLLIDEAKSWRDNWTRKTAP